MMRTLLVARQGDLKRGDKAHSSQEMRIFITALQAAAGELLGILIITYLTRFERFLAFLPVNYS